ncbi:hypothetical protein F4780DRAFT_783336 [Xylariomycetidae sp. FL0641]|nr:hypothetical protein F4780DRAFT_783336 [Xylariomycetidae sp. FL0641]
MAIITLFYLAMMAIAAGSIVICDGLDTNSIQFCRNYSGPIVLLNAAFNAVTDFWILIVPIPPVLRLNLRLKQKLGLLAVFTAGLARDRLFSTSSSIRKRLFSDGTASQTLTLPTKVSSASLLKKQSSEGPKNMYTELHDVPPFPTITQPAAGYSG